MVTMTCSDSSVRVNSCFLPLKPRYTNPGQVVKSNLTTWDAASHYVTQFSQVAASPQRLPQLHPAHDQAGCEAEAVTASLS